MEQINPEGLTRFERRGRLRYYKKQLKKHMVLKPTVNVAEEDPRALEKRQAEIRAWSTRYNILLAKIHEFEAHIERNKKQR